MTAAVTELSSIYDIEYHRFKCDAGVTIGSAYSIAVPICVCRTFVPKTISSTCQCMYKIIAMLTQQQQQQHVLELQSARLVDDSYDDKCKVV
jgi:hypothetical protein